MPKLVQSFDNTIATIRAEETPRANKEIKFESFGITQLPQLINQLPSRTEVHNSEYPNPRFTIRYIVTPQGLLLFGFEGLPSPKKGIPSHAHLAEKKCISAGNITFSDDYQQIISIDNRSGDFRPPEDTVNYALAILIHYTDNIRLADPLMVCGEPLTVSELTSRIKDTPIVSQLQRPTITLTSTKRKAIEEDSKTTEIVPPPSRLQRHILFSPEPTIPDRTVPVRTPPSVTPRTP